MLVRRATTAAALVVLFATGASACGGKGSSTASTSKGAAGGPLLTYHRSGGIAYSNVYVVVDRDGTATVKALGPTGTKTQDVTVDADQLDRLSRLVESTSLSDLPKRQALGCADCYQYQIAYGGDRYATDEASTPAPLKPIVAVLESIIGGTQAQK